MRLVSSVRLVVLAAVLALLVPLATPFQAGAAKPVFFTDSWDFIEEFDDVCGQAGLTATVRITGQVDGQIRATKKSEHLFASVHLKFTDYWTGPNGKVVTVSANRRERDKSITDNGDGTITVQVKVTGAAITITGPNGERSIDRGLVIFAVDWDYNGTPQNLDDDTPLGSRIVKMAGPHPDLADGGAFCPIAVPAFTS